MIKIKPSFLEKGADVEFLECTHEACWEADVIFILNNEKNFKDVSEKIDDVSIQKIVVTLLNNETVNPHFSQRIIYE